MSNPVATIGNSIPTPADPKVSRVIYSSLTFSQQEFYSYDATEFTPPAYGSFDPSDKGQRFFIYVSLTASLDDNCPQFVSEEVWATYKTTTSGFLTARDSIMPVLIIPSTQLVDNGIVMEEWSLSAFYEVPTEEFNWNVVEFNGSSIDVTKMIEYAKISSNFSSQYVALVAKDDTVAENVLEISLESPPQLPSGVAPISGPQGWNVGHDLVVDGAFLFMLNVTPSLPAAAGDLTAQKNPWAVRFEFGDVIMELDEVGALKVKFTSGVDRETNEQVVNLAEGKAKGSTPQASQLETIPYMLIVIPVWNGIIVASGNQQSKEVRLTTATFVPMKKGRSVLLEPYSTGFDPTAPASVEVGVGSGATNVIPNFGDKLTLKVTNARCEIAYLPCFFSREMWFDEWFVASDDVAGVVDYTYTVYPIWTANGTGAVLGDVTPQESVYVGPVADTSYWTVPWRLSMDKADRYAGEIFGAILGIEEERDFPIKNANGNFQLNWTGGTPGDPSPSTWSDYVQSISVSIGLDGSSGSIAVDRYGVAGQDSVAIQSIGAITVSIDGGNGTVGGSIFKGLGMGIGEQVGVDGATWTIPMIGLEKKMEDIALINVPFVDGFTVKKAVTFLTKYCGLNLDTSHALNAGIDKLSVSEDVNVARFDWKSGTSVKSAMEDIMNDVNYNYVVRDGVVYLYELDNFGVPVIGGIDFQPLYPDTILISEDQQPDFDDLRNELVIIGLEEVPEGTGTKIGDIPLWPRFEKRTTVTSPDVPWAKSIVSAIPGSLTQDELSDIADKIQAKSSTYLMTGRTTIPGNAEIRPYDRWGDFYIFSVSHQIDFSAKTWTTDLEFIAKT